jgi:hypothetical protein
VVEGQVKNRICRRGAGAQAVQIFQRAVMNLSPHLRQGRGAGVGTGQAQDFVPCSNEFANHGRAHKAGRSGDKNTHEKAFQDWTGVNITAADILVK